VPWRLCAPWTESQLGFRLSHFTTRDVHRMAQTLLQVQRQIEKLQETEERLKRQEASGVIARMKEAIRVYGFTPDDLFGNVQKAALGPKPTAPSVAKTAKSKAGKQARYADGGGNEWVGRGPRPLWLRTALESGKALSDFAVKSGKTNGAQPATRDGKSSAEKTPKKMKKKQTISIKYRDTNGNTWTGRGWKPLWLKSAIESGKTLEEFAV